MNSVDLDKITALIERNFPYIKITSYGASSLGNHEYAVNFNMKEYTNAKSVVSTSVWTCSICSTKHNSRPSRCTYCGVLS